MLKAAPMVKAPTTISISWFCSEASRQEREFRRWLIQVFRWDEPPAGLPRWDEAPGGAEKGCRWPALATKGKRGLHGERSGCRVALFGLVDARHAYAVVHARHAVSALHVLGARGNKIDAAVTQAVAGVLVVELPPLGVAAAAAAQQGANGLVCVGVAREGCRGVHGISFVKNPGAPPLKGKIPRGMKSLAKEVRTIDGAAMRDRKPIVFRGLRLLQDRCPCG